MFRRLPSVRLNPVQLGWVAAFFLATFGNLVLWRSLWPTVEIEGMHGLLFAISLPVFLFCVLNLLLTPVLALPYHQIGSHGPTYFERHSLDARVFSPSCDINQNQKCSNEALVNTYDNTLVDTDRMLGKTIELLQERSSERDVALIHLSDR